MAKLPPAALTWSFAGGGFQAGLAPPCEISRRCHAAPFHGPDERPSVLWSLQAVPHE